MKRIAMFYSYDGAKQGYRAYAETTQGWVWMGGFSNYVDSEKVCEFAASHGRQIVDAMPEGSHVKENPNWDTVKAEFDAEIKP